MTSTLEGHRAEVADARPKGAVTVNQLSRRGVLAVWAAAALPMAALSWIVAPLVAGHGSNALIKPMLLLMTAGLVWQSVLVAGLVAHEQRSLRWSRVRDALWLRAPRSPRTGRVGGKLWLLVIPLIVAFAVEEMISFPGQPHARDLGAFLSSDAGHAMFHGAWGWFALVLVMVVCNTVIGEELLFRGYLLPRMQGAFGERDWVVNGVLFATYHLHMPWVIPTAMFDTLLLSYPSKRYRSAWMGIAVHSAQSIVILIAVFALVV